MKKWTFNTGLLTNLAEVLGTSFTQIGERAGMIQQTFYRYVSQRKKFELTVQRLIALCNAWRLPIYYFIAEDGMHLIPQRMKAVVPEDEWQPIKWDYDAVERTFGDGDGRIYWIDVAVAMGKTGQVPHDKFQLKRRFTISEFLNTCTELQLSPYTFLIDNNRPEVREKVKPSEHGTTKKSKMTGGASKDLLREMDNLRGEVAALKEKVDDQTRWVAKLQQDYATLLSDYTSLSSYMRKHYEIHLADPDERPLFAADPGTDDPGDKA